MERRMVNRGRKKKIQEGKGKRNIYVYLYVYVYVYVYNFKVHRFLSILKKIKNCRNNCT